MFQQWLQENMWSLQKPLVLINFIFVSVKMRVNTLALSICGTLTPGYGNLQMFFENMKFYKVMYFS